jgi:hypothetical protein
MPKKEKHIEQAQHNIDFLQSFYKCYEYNDWSITVGFYAALHIIEAAIDKIGKVAFNEREYQVNGSDELNEIIHRERDSIKNPSPARFNVHKVRKMIVEENFEPISLWYANLYTDSQTARYKIYIHKNQNVDLTVKKGLKAIVDWFKDEHNEKVDFKI